MIVNLVRFKKNGTPLFFDLRDGLTVIGRSSKCRCRIPIKSVSRKHCQVQVQNDKIEISDLGSRNGTLVNNTPILEPYMIKAGDSLQIGPVKLIFQVDGQPDMKNNVLPQEQAQKQVDPPAKPKVTSAKQAQPVTPSKTPIKQAPTEEKNEDIEDELGFLDDELFLDKDVDSLGSASSLH